MCNTILYRVILVLLTGLSVCANAQDTMEVMPPMVDSTSLDYDTENYDLDEAPNKVLYFTGKEDTTALYDSSTVLWRSVPDGVVQEWKHDDAFWYADKNLQQKKKEFKRQNDSWWKRLLESIFNFLSNPIVLRILFYCIIFLFVLAAAWFLINNQMNIFGKSKGRIKTTRDLHTSGEDLLNTDLDQALRDAEQNKDYRLAVRIRYLLLLKVLSEQQLIQYREDATNLDYLTQLYGRSYYQPFFSLTRHYEYAWYGEAEVTANVYQRLTSDFQSLHQNLLTV